MTAATKQSDNVFTAAAPQFSDAITPLIYESVHELMDFMFASRERAESVLRKLTRKPQGQFGYRFATVMLRHREVVGVELGYDAKQLAAQELPGAINMLRASPWSRWPHLIGTANKALSGYVPAPSADAYYINNIAVSSEHRGLGLGTALLDHIVDEARTNGYRSVELDVTDINTDAIRFYRRYGFFQVSESGSDALMQSYALPKLKRMRYLLRERGVVSVDNAGATNSTIVVNDITGLNPIEVDEVYAPGSVAQLQAMLRFSDKPISIGGGRFSMGGQIAHQGTLHIDMRGMNRVLEVDPEQRLLRTQAGARWKDIQSVIADYGLSVKIMQTYANFTVGGSLSVNCHGRYLGMGPIILSVRSITLLLHNGELLTASPTDNAQYFFGAIGGYGALGIIVEAELELAENNRIARTSRRMLLSNYPDFFSANVRHNSAAVFHNADMVPPNFRRVRATTWQETEKAVNDKTSDKRHRLYLAEKYMLWAITETPAGHWRREFIYEPLLFLREKVTVRNREADYDVAELEPLSRGEKTYVLQEYFVPIDRLLRFAERMTEILRRHNAMVVNVSIRHAIADSGSLLAWAREEVFALVLYYKQGTQPHDRERVAVWTRELINAVLDCDGTYYLPYQPHAQYAQFHAAYPRARELFALKDEVDPHYRFRNVLWRKYYREQGDPPLFGDRQTSDSEFLTVYGKVETRDSFYRFLQVIFHLYPEERFHQLIIDSCERYDSDQEIYQCIARTLPTIKTTLSELTYALPALGTQKREMTRQTVEILSGKSGFDGYLEIGSTGRYVKKLKKALNIRGKIFLSNETLPDNSPAELMERGGIRHVGKFFPLDDYAAIPSDLIGDESLDLVTCFIGLHHCPRAKLANYIGSIHRVLRPGGRFVLRDHDAGSEEMRTFCALVHTVFNVGLGVSWEEDRQELRLFEGVDFWVEAVAHQGFEDSGKRLLQQNDPSLNTLLCFTKHT